MRSRTNSLPRASWRWRAFSPPPWAMAAVSSRSLPTSARIAASLAWKPSLRGLIWVFRMAINGSFSTSPMN